MTFPPDPPVRPEQRDVTPEERRRAGRFFWLLLLGFLLLVGVIVAYLSMTGRQVRDYGQVVMQEMAKQSAPPKGVVPCATITSTPAPASIKTCTVERSASGNISVTMETTKGQKYKMSRGS